MRRSFALERAARPEDDFGICRPFLISLSLSVVVMLLRRYSGVHFHPRRFLNCTLSLAVLSTDIAFAVAGCCSIGFGRRCRRPARRGVIVAVVCRLGERGTGDAPLLSVSMLWSISISPELRLCDASSPLSSLQSSLSSSS